MKQTFFTFAVAITLGIGLLDAQWRPITPEELAMKQPKSEPNADAEALFRDVRLLNEAATFGYPHNVISEYIRLKIFTDRGRDKYGTVQIPYAGKSIISGVEGRTINPDGSIVELKKDAVFDKVVEQKRRGIKFRAVSFAMPAVQPGSIIEYRYTRNVGEFISRYVPIDVQTPFPIDELTFHIKPVSGQWVHWPPMRYYPFGCKIDKFAPEVNGFTEITLHSIPAFHEEPYMPPEHNVKQWILLYYDDHTDIGEETYWTSLGRDFYKSYSAKLKINDEVRSIANEVTTGVTGDEEKVARLFDYCRKNLKDIHGTEITTQEREQAKENKTTIETLRRKEGTVEDINLAFAALANAAGYEARMAWLSDRSRFLFSKQFQSPFFLSEIKVAVKIGDQWKFYDVTNRSLAPGQLRWQEQGVLALLADAKDPEFVATPLLPAGQSAAQHIATFKLSPEGTLEGDIRTYYLGNRAAAWRDRFALANDAEREAALREDIKERFADFDLTDVKFATPADLSKGIGVYYHIAVRNYAQRTGKRLFVTPAYFEAGLNARFTDTVRHQPVYFDYPWSERDEIQIELPDGYQLDHADSPAPLNFPPEGQYSVTMALTKDNKLIYHRELSFGGSTLPLFEAKVYPTIKQIFDRIHENDNHMLTLKAAAQASAEVH